MHRQSELRSSMRRRARLLVAILGLFAAYCAGPEAVAETGAAPEVAAHEPADLLIANRYVTTLRSEVYGTSPAERVASIRERIGVFLAEGGTLTVSTRTMPEGAIVLINGRIAFRILATDVSPDSGETVEAAAQAARQRLEIALLELEEARDARAMLPAAGFALAASVVLGIVLWLLFRFSRWVAARAQRVIGRKTAELAPTWFSHVVGRAGPQAIVSILVRVAVWFLALLCVYEYAGFVLRQFPYTRPWGEKLEENLLDALGHFSTGILTALPGLVFVALIFAFAYWIARVLRAFFRGVEAKRIQVGWVDETTARPTERVAAVVIWLFALVAAYPYLPGSDSEAFKGVGVFVGLMLSLGASGVVNQAVSGLMLMYTRMLRPGEYVRIGELEGTVTTIGFLTTRLETLRREEISIPNSVIATSTTRNFSRLGASGPLQITTQVTIGYDTPWRQVEALLLAAAARTQRVAETPPPRVLQSDLLDFYVRYTLIVAIENPRERYIVLNELHGHVQDLFNEHGVQIMSPNYEADPQSPKVVSREEWFKSPAVEQPIDAAQTRAASSTRP
jgi:small-conductance mechanosensitive channel